MRNRFNINESEKSRIKDLHGMMVIKEQQLPKEIEECLLSNISLRKDREFFKELPIECMRIIGYEVSKGIGGKKAAKLLYPNHLANDTQCALKGLHMATKDDETFDMVMDKVNDVIDCMVAKGMSVDLQSLSDTLNVQG